MSEITVLTRNELRDLLQEAAQKGAEQALQAYNQPDRLVNQTEAAQLLGVAPNYFSQARLWEYIPYSTLIGGDKRYRVSDVLRYKGPSQKDITDHNPPAPPAPATAQPTQRRGRRSMLSNLQNAAE